MRKRCLLLALLIPFAAGCLGPKPRIVKQSLRAPQNAGESWQLAVTVENGGRGEGQGQITSRLLDPRGNVVAQEARDIDLRAHETITVTLPLDPSSPGPYHVTSEVQAPPG